MSQVVCIGAQHNTWLVYILALYKANFWNDKSCIKNLIWHPYSQIDLINTNKWGYLTTMLTGGEKSFGLNSGAIENFGYDTGHIKAKTTEQVDRENTTNTEEVLAVK